MRSRGCPASGTCSVSPRRACKQDAFTPHLVARMAGSGNGMRLGARPGTIQPMSATESRARALLDAARELAPAIRDAALQIEESRELPKPLFKAMADAGLFHMMVPHQLGGAELDMPSYIQIVEEIARADASTAWCLNQGGI